MGDIRTPVMDWSRPDRIAAYKLFRQKAVMYFECKEVSDAKQVSYILLMMGDEGLSMYNSWDMSEEDSKSPEAVWTKFDGHIEPKSSFRVERLTFQRMSQRADEASDDFLSRLINQANLCKFQGRDERIIEQITYGTKHPEVQKALLVQEEEYTLAQAMDACRVHDASVGHHKAFTDIQGQGGELTVNAVAQYKSSSQCYQCGEVRHKSYQGCPAEGSICRTCGGKDHWAKARACPANKHQDVGHPHKSWPQQQMRRQSRHGGRGRADQHHEHASYQHCEQASRSAHPRYRQVDNITNGEYNIPEEQFIQVHYD